MTTTAKLGMTLWEAGSGNPSPAHNDALSRLDFFASNTVLSRSTDAQPSGAAEGDAYIITGSATGDDWGASPFAEGDIAVYETIDGITGWYRYAPVAGFPMVVQDESLIVAWNGSAYESVGGEGLTNPMTTAGDIIKGGASGVPERLAIGTEGEALCVRSGVPAWTGPTESIIIACSDETTALTTGDGKVTFRMPYAFTLTAVRASVTTAPTGSGITVDITEAGVSVLSTLLTIDATEKTSTTAATPAVISDSALADDAEIQINIDVVGSTIAGAGLKVYLIGYRP